MKKKSKKGVVALAIAIVFLIIQVLIMMYAIHSIQGNGRVVNYADIVRGATQRLVKKELYGNIGDKEIERLDDILLGLQTGEGSQELTVLDDEDYQSKLRILAAEWEKVKEDIYAARTDEGKRDDLYELSEKYFVLADETVSAAEAYSDGIAKRLNKLELSVSANILIIMAMFFAEFASEIKHSRNLNRIAYIDPQTGLPNKRSCDEKMNDVTLIEEDKNVCCIMFDLNNLKVTNDTLGHEAGDALICAFASLLRRSMPDDMFVGRLGGDEFIGIQMNSNKEEILQRIAKMQGEASDAEGSLQSNFRISFAHGYAFSKDQYVGCTIKTLMNIADKNMYINKQAMKKQQNRN